MIEVFIQSSGFLLCTLLFEGSASNKMKSLYWECRRRMGYKTPPHTALDNLGSILNKEGEGQETTIFSKEDEADSDEDMVDLVFRKAILPGRTGDFDKDFLPSPKVAKGGKGHLKKSSEKVSKEDLAQSMSVPQGDGNSIIQGKAPDINANECFVATESDSISSSPGRLSDLDIHGNIQPSDTLSTSPPNEVATNSAGFVNDSLPLTHAGNITYMIIILERI